MKKSTMKQKGTVTVTITCPAPHTAAARQPLTITATAPIIAASTLIPHEEEVVDPDDGTNTAVTAQVYALAIQRTPEGLAVVPAWQCGGVRQTIGDGQHTALVPPLTVETVRHGDVEGWYTQDTFHRAPGETMPHLHRSGTRGHFDADLTLTTDSQGQRTLTIVNRDIPFLLAAAGKTGLIG